MIVIEQQLEERVIPRLANEIGCLSAARFQEYQRALAHAADVLSQRVERKAALCTRIARLRSTLDVAPAEQTLEREIRAERCAKAQRRAAASCIVQSALAAATATAIAAAVAAVPSTATTTSESGERVIGWMTGFFV